VSGAHRAGLGFAGGERRRAARPAPLTGPKG
jgi:hypothetical protein